MAAIVIAAVALLLFVVFPAIEPHLPWNDVTVDSPSLSQSLPGLSPSPALLPG
ncbi:MAG: hypothetical protein ACRDNS_09485 [Trebonia sp.]